MKMMHRKMVLHNLSSIRRKQAGQKRIWRKALLPRSFLWSLGLVAASLHAGNGMAQLSLPESVERNSLQADAFSTGTLTPAQGALPPSLWRGSDQETLEFLLDHSPSRPALPAIGEALRRTLLSSSSNDEGNRASNNGSGNGLGANQELAALSGVSPTDNLTSLPPLGNAVSQSNSALQNLGGKKLLALVNAGFIGEVQTIASLSDAPQGDPFVGKALALADLLNRNETQACQRGAAITEQGGDPFWLKLRAFCYVVAGERDAADLTMSILRDQGAVTVQDDEFLTAMITGAVPAKPLHPKTALQLAVVRHLEIPIVASWVKQADGAVLKSVALDNSLDLSVRLEAAKFALAMGNMGTVDYSNLLLSVPVELEAINQAATLLAQNPNQAMIDAIVYQAVRSMNAPAFLKDKANLIADHLQSANGFEHAFALNSLYANDVQNLQGAIVPPLHAGLYAQSRLVVGDSDGAARWLLNMKGEEPITALGESIGRSFMELTGLLNLLDPEAAAGVAQSANIAVPDLFEGRVTQTKQFELSQELLSADLVETVFDAAMGFSNSKVGKNPPARKKQGQAALAAIALSDITLSQLTSAEVAPLHNAVTNQAFQIAGLGDVSHAISFQSAWKIIKNQSKQAVPRITQQAPVENDDGFTPSLKPRSTGP